MQVDQLVTKVLLGSVGGVQQRGKPPKKWTDITEWTELTLCEAVRLSEDGETCRKIVSGPKGC